MEFRTGTCSACGATYKVPASFHHTRAKCKQCGGAVAIGPVETAAAGDAPPVPAKKALPAPAQPPATRKPALPSAPAAAKPAPSAPAGASPGAPPGASSSSGTKTGADGLTMKERLLAERQAQAAGGGTKPSALSSGALSPSPLSPSVSPARPQAKAPARPAASAPAKPASGSKRPRRGAAVGAAAGAADEPAGGTRGSRTGRPDSRSRRDGRRRGEADEPEEGDDRRGRGRHKKKSPLPILLGAGGLVIALGVGWYFVLGPGAGNESNAADAESAAAGANDGGAVSGEPAQPAQPAAADAGPDLAKQIKDAQSALYAAIGAELESRDIEHRATDVKTFAAAVLSEQRGAADDAGFLQMIQGKADGDALTAITDRVAQQIQDAAAAAERERFEKTDPALVTYDDLDPPQFGPWHDTTDEEWAQMQELMTQWFDPDAGARGPRAKKQLMEMHRKAFPVMWNALTKLDYGTDEGQRQGDEIQRTLTEMCKGTNWGWKYSSEREDHRYNKEVVRRWHKTIKQALESDKAWANIRKQEISEIPDPTGAVPAGGGDSGGAAGGDDIFDVDD